MPTTVLNLAQNDPFQNETVQDSDYIKILNFYEVMVAIFDQIVQQTVMTLQRS